MLKIKEQNRALVFHLIQLVITSLMGIPLYSLAPLFEAANSTHRFIDTALAKVVLQIVWGGMIVFAAGILIDGD